MTIYSVHRHASEAAAHTAQRVHFERQGFAWAAFFFGPLWLLARRLWRALLVWLILAGLIADAAIHGYVSSGAVWLLGFLCELYLGLAGASLAAAAYDRGKWRLADIAVGPDRVTAERNFFSRLPAPEATQTRRSAAPPPPPGSDVIGLFPDPGRMT